MMRRSMPPSLVEELFTQKYSYSSRKELTAHAIV